MGHWDVCLCVSVHMHECGGDIHTPMHVHTHTHIARPLTHTHAVAHTPAHHPCPSAHLPVLPMQEYTLVGGRTSVSKVHVCQEHVTVLQVEGGTRGGGGGRPMGRLMSGARLMPCRVMNVVPLDPRLCIL